MGHALTRVWNFELTSYDDSITVEGRTVTGRRSITLGKVLRVLLTVALGFWFAGWIARWLSRRFARRVRFDASRALLAERAIYISLIIIVVIMALSATKIPLAAFAFLGGALAIGIGFGAQNLINNFICGIMMLIERTVKLGDIVEVEGERGTVERVGARSTLIRRADGKELIVPNSSFLEKNVINWTHSDKLVRLTIPVGVAYGSSTRRTAELIQQAADVDPQVIKDPKPLVAFEEFGDSALQFTLYVWVNLAWIGLDQRVVGSEIRHRINDLLTAEGIVIAFPQRDVHLNVGKPLQVEIVTKPQPQQDSRQL